MTNLPGQEGMMFMFNLAVNPRDDFEPHRDALYKQLVHKCGSCDYEKYNFLYVPGRAEKFETKEQMLERLTSLASNLWDQAKSIT